MEATAVIVANDTGSAWNGVRVIGLVDEHRWSHVRRRGERTGMSASSSIILTPVPGRLWSGSALLDPWCRPPRE